MELGLRNKTAIVTGASKGIGAEVARVFAMEGVNLVLVARSNEELQALKLDLEQDFDVAITIISIDITEASAVARIAEAADNVDILVNNAGAIPAGNLWQVDSERWRAAWDLKVFGYIDLTRAIYPKLKARGGGVIINNIGAGGDIHDANYICGNVGNAALMAFSRTIGGRSLDDGIRVLGVNPGTIENERIQRFFRTRAEMELGDEERFKELMSSLPGGRLGTNKEIADMIVFLASPLSSYTSGTIVTVDGGLSCRQSVI